MREILLALAMSALPAALLQAADEPARYEVRYEFEGNDEVSSHALTQALRGLTVDLKRTGVNQPAVDDAVYELERFYQSQGFRLVHVRSRWVREEDGYRIRFFIIEGPRSYLKSLEIRGNTHFESKDLAECFQWKRAGFFRLGPRIFTQETLDEGIHCIVNRYLQEGFYFAEAVPMAVEDPFSLVQAAVEVREGPRIWLRRPPALEGVRAVSDLEVRLALKIDPPIAYSIGLPLILKGRVIDLYRNRGYRFVQVDVDRKIDREAGEATLTIRVEEGPLTRIEDVRIIGNQLTWNWVVRKMIKLKAGDLYREELVRDSYRNMLRSGVFSTINMDTVPIEGQPGQVHLDVRVDEKPRYRASILAGYGSYELLRGGLALEDGNLFGSGNSLRVEALASFRGEKLRGEYLNPLFLHERLYQSVEALYERREHPSFSEREYGGEAGVGFRATERLRSTLMYRLRQSNSFEVDDDVPPELIEDVLLSTVVISGIYERRDSILDPTRGSFHRVSLEYGGSALGSELDILRLTAQTSWVFSLGGGVRMVLSARAGAIERLEDTDVIPIQERFFNGGESSIRSFEEDGAGPRVGGEPIGGECYTIYNVEIRFPLPFMDRLQLAAFADAGTLNERVEDFAQGRHFVGLGAGLRYLTPFGPLRLDTAVNPDRHEDEDTFEVHFGLGYPF